MSDTTVIIGGSGEVGGLFARHLDGPVIILDKVAPQDKPDHVSYCPVSDASTMVADHGAALSSAGTIMLALPEDVALALLPEVAAVLAPGALLIDTLSVKGSVCARLEELCRARDAVGSAIECLSINPMFAPSLGFAGQCVAVVAIRTETRAADFLAAMETWGARNERLDAAAHDEATAAMQVATHAAILAFGASLLESDYDVGRVMAFAPPPHRALMALLARICAGEPEVYRDIQASNTLAPLTRRRLGDGVSALDRCIETHDPAAFEAFIAELRECLAPELDHLAGDCRAMFEALRK